MYGNDNYLTVEYDLKLTECPCGSGKEPNKCCGYVKPRTHTALLDRRNFDESDGIAIGLDYSLKRVVNGQLLPIIGKPIFVHSHARENKSPKVILKGKADVEFIMDPNAVFRMFDHAFVIDTNTRDFNENKISMSGIVDVEINQGTLKCIPITLFEFWDVEITPEILGWYSLIQAIQDSERLKYQKIAFIVDSSLGNLDDYNEGKTALFDDFFLPKNITLIYASADKMSSIANKLIKLADRMANAQFNKITKNIEIESLKETIYPCKYFRQWLP